MYRTVHLFISLTFYVLLGAIWHDWLFGPLHWDTLRTLGIVAFWPVLVGLWITKWVIIIGLAIGAMMLVWFAISGARSRFRIWRLRQSIKPLLKRKVTNVE